MLRQLIMQEQGDMFIYWFPYRDCSQESFRYISHNDANEEDNSLQPGVTQDDGQDEECNTQEDSHTCDNMDEVLDFFSDGGFASLQARS